MKSRLEQRKINEAAEAREDGDGEKTEKKAKRAVGKKKPAKKKSRGKPVERRRLMWVIFNSTQKEEDRFTYDQRKEAEERLDVLRSKSKRLYWLQAVKEVMGAAPPGSETPGVYSPNYVAEVEEEVVEAAEAEEEEEEEKEEEEEEDEDEE